MPAKVTIFNNGSIRLEGEFTVHDADGKEFGLSGRTTIGLCRCGASENKPFCDGSHNRIGFQSQDTAPPPVVPPTATENT